mmetsp:Transcript_13998/g.33074  ORF Transcript_13998/g.33074 Transcript_13998/m.33074 type:complete len:523 (-) Transcript_13998:311-1879(-)
MTKAEDPFTLCASASRTWTFVNTQEKLLRVLELSASVNTRNTTDHTKTCGLQARATTYHALGTDVKRPWTQRGEPLTFWLPFSDKVFVRDFVKCYTAGERENGFFLRNDTGVQDLAAPPVGANCVPNPGFQDKPAANDFIMTQQQSMLQDDQDIRCELDISTIAKCFHLPISDAARKLQVGETWLKQKCRQYGINRWPYRKVRSIEKAIHKLEKALRDEKSVPGSSDAHKILSLTSQLQQLAQKKERVCMGQWHPTDDDDEANCDEKAAATFDPPVSEGADKTAPCGILETTERKRKHRSPKRILEFDEDEENGHACSQPRPKPTGAEPLLLLSPRPGNSKCPKVELPSSDDVYQHLQSFYSCLSPCAWLSSPMGGRQHSTPQGSNEQRRGSVLKPEPMAVLASPFRIGKSGHCPPSKTPLSSKACARNSPKDGNGMLSPQFLLCLSPRFISITSPQPTSSRDSQSAFDDADLNNLLWCEESLGGCAASSPGYAGLCSPGVIPRCVPSWSQLQAAVAFSPRL